MTSSDAASLLLLLTAAFPDGMRFLDERQAEASRVVMRQFLLDLDFDPARDAVMRGIAILWKKWPSIAEIRLACTQQVDGRQTAGGEAWGAVLRAVKGAGIHRVPGRDFDFRDPLVLRCVRAFGWAEICNSEMMAADRARFIDLYDKLASERTADHTTGQLAPVPPCHALRRGEPSRLGVIVAGLLPEGAKEQDE